MKTAGEILTAARKEKKWDLNELSRRTKIQEQHLAAIEKSDFKHLPPTPFTKGFIRTIAMELGLNPEGIIAIFRRDFDTSGEGQIIPREWSGSRRKRLNWTPKTTLIAGIGLVIAVFSFYIIWQIKLLVKAPKLTLTYPQEGAVVSQNVFVEGQTETEATVTINGQEIKKNKDGSFNQTVSLGEGTHVITIVSSGINGKKTTLQRTVVVKGE